ncbi:MAG: lytic transglycosylase domain-containing protein [Candidatus Adiutrix sp.]
MDINQLSQLLNSPQNKLGRHPMAATLGLNGHKGPTGQMGQGDNISIPSLGGNSSTSFQDLIAMAQNQSYAQGPALGADLSQETAKSLARLKAMSINNDMLSNLVSLNQGGEFNGGAGLVAHMNLEALLSSGSFGNLANKGNELGGLDKGKNFNQAQMNSFRNKNGFLRGNAPDSENSSDESLSLKPSEAAQAAHAAQKAINGAFANKGLSTEVGRALQAAAGDIKSSKANDESLSANQLSNELKDTEKPTMAAIDKIVAKVSQALGLDSNLVKAVIKAESNFNHQAVSRAGAKGLMQLMPGTAKELGVEDPFNPVENIWGGARYLKKMLDRHGGNLDKALASYNWGPGNFARQGPDKMPSETRRYIQVVNQHYNSFSRESASG